MKNRLKTLMYFLGYFLVLAIGIRTLAFISNKIFDDVSNFLYVPSLGFLLGFGPLTFAAEKALDVTENEKNTKRIIIGIYSIIAFLSISMGIFNLWGRIEFDLPIFDFIDDDGDITNHWLYYFPYGFSLIIALIRIQKNIFLETNF